MAGAFGYKFIFFSLIFYLFIGLILSLDNGAGARFLAGNISTNNTYVAGNYTTNVTDVNPSTWDYSKYILQNPFSNIAILAWLSVAILITNIYIIVTSVIP